jgi:putative inorganic carbon (HCO3(-)) transporter
MSSPARPAGSTLMQANLGVAPVSALVIAAMAMGFLWSADHDDQRCVELVLLALLVPLMLARAGTAGQIAWMGRPAGYFLAAFFALGVASSLGAFSLRHALYEWSILLLLLLAAALLAAELARTGTKGLHTLLRGVVVVGILYSLRMALMYAAILGSGVQSSFSALAVGFSNERFFNHAQTALLPLVVLLYLQTPKGSRWRRAAFALAACWWSYLFLSEARASILGLAAGCALVFLTRRAHARSFLKAMALSALAGVVVYVLAFVLLPVLMGRQPFGAVMNVVQRTAANPTSDRMLMWRLCLELIAAHPWLGVGPHHFAHQQAALGWGAHPHDFLLQIGAEWGLPALLCLLAAIGIGMRGLVRSAGRIAEADLPGQQTLAVLLAAGTAILVDGLFSGVLVMPQSQIAIVLYLACAAGWMRSLDKRPARHAGKPLRWLTSSLAVLALCGLAYGVAPSIEGHASHAPLTPAEQARNPGVQWPRLWEAGHF